ncbi:hypothetical protein PHMEG_00016307 [Phytophthora megakarya]|uniref:Uncharacterized protein n=1 Tax=Phytophthora megakarya TaxID=4795 RepID=A0A225VZB1_9STRA|nr:hypothetical protein PHMEG_00016307 [Phytophthora megakarya]
MLAHVRRRTSLLVRRTPVRASSSDAFRFEKLALENEQLLPAPTVTQRVLEYLQVDSRHVQRVVSTEELRPLPYKALFAPLQAHRLTPLVQWGFQQLKGESQAADAVFRALEPHANMVRSTVWRQYFLRHFFLSGAPLRAYLQAFEIHSTALDATRAIVEDEEEEEDEEEDELAASVKSKHVPVTRRKEYPSKGETAILADNKEWEWVPMHVASSIVKEFCFRGRFAEAIEAYASLPLLDATRRDVVVILQDYQQYSSVLYLYEVHRAMGGAVKPLDVAPELDALKKVGRIEEMDLRFQELPFKEQSRADIQTLMGN